MVIATAAYINKDSLSAWKAVLYNRNKIPDLKNNLSPDLESEWWDDEWWDELFEDEGSSKSSFFMKALEIATISYSPSSYIVSNLMYL